MTPVKPKRERMTNGNGNGNGYSNGNGRTFSWASGLINIATSGVLLAVFAIWWSVADPSKRMEKIADDQKLYLTKAEHVEFATGVANVAKQLEEKHERVLTKEEFTAWKTERDHLIANMEKRLEDFRVYTVNFYEKFEKLPEFYVPRAESSKLFDITQARIDRLYGIMDEMSKRIDARETVSVKDQSQLHPDK